MMIKALDVADKLGLYLKIVTTTSSFENYNSFFNIYTDMEEPCRRVAVLTPYKDLEEVTEVDLSKPIEKLKIIDNNLWIEEYPLTVNPKTIKLEDIYIPEETCDVIKKSIKF
ncbi:hypothetical protein NNC19_02830 [Clostridium sp. SHJSY1]|uniref:hypothetical protein n=1 Tax=Clostridium sp. SHJSY1 TaxID=2942483 RepID=UPI0028767F8D|nr:hypothetical protein [Clostridium sp. SHJSY1]MDS0524597.1 hypothetical protein [Clostridium sp. SHJSY1]